MFYQIEVENRMINCFDPCLNLDISPSTVNRWLNKNHLFCIRKISVKHCLRKDKSNIIYYSRAFYYELNEVSYFVKDNYLLHQSVNTPSPKKQKTKQKNAKNKSNKKNNNT